MNIKEFRALVDDALATGGFTPKRLTPKWPQAWTLGGTEVVPLFRPQAHRRPWGFWLMGYAGLELPELRSWLEQHKGREGLGIFKTAFVFYHILNDEMLRNFNVTMDRPIAADEWVSRLKQRLESVPDTIDELIATYRRSPDQLGHWARDRQAPAWDFLIRWRTNPDPSLEVPQSLI